jgi:Tfp pilus assembly protein PilX
MYNKTFGATPSNFRRVRGEGQRGVALILTLILIAVISVMAVSLMFLSQSETWGSANYRLMSQARDGAEAGIHKTAHFLTHNLVTVTGSPADNAYYNEPGSQTIINTNFDNSTSALADGTVNDHNSGLTAGFTTTGSSIPSTAVDYYDATEEANFAAYGSGTIPAGATTVNYATAAELMAVFRIQEFGGASKTVQTWRITSDAWANGVQPGTVRVSAILDTPITPTFNYAVFAEGTQCDMLTLTGGADITSYNSSVLVGGVPVLDQWGGNVGTNGSLTTSGSTTNIYGTLSSPLSGVGNCGNGGLTAWDPNNGTLAGGLVGLPGEIYYEPPLAPTPVPPTTSRNLTNSASCTNMNATWGAGMCTPFGATGNVFTLAPTCGAIVDADGNTTNTEQCGSGLSYGNLSVGAGKTIRLTAGTYNFNSLSIGSGAVMQIVSGPVMINLKGAGVGANQAVLSITSDNAIVNTTYKADNLKIIYDGHSDINLRGGSSSAAVVYAPDADIFVSGNVAFYGSVIGETVTVNGSGGVSYDRGLQKKWFRRGNPVLQSFSWEKF